MSKLIVLGNYLFTILIFFINISCIAEPIKKINISNNLSDDYSSSWSPDGKKIMFVSNRDGNREIYIMNSDGSSQNIISKNPSDEI